jgi:hypothetical protein
LEANPYSTTQICQKATPIGDFHQHAIGGLGGPDDALDNDPAVNGVHAAFPNA